MRISPSAPLFSIAAVLVALASPAEDAGSPPSVPARAVAAVPDGLRADFELAPFYQKCVDADGFPIVGSARVSDYALLEAAYLIDILLQRRPDVRKRLIENRVRFAVMAAGELTTAIPEHSDLQPGRYWDRRARGLGATRVRPAVSCGEENLLGFPGDPYATENILIHEFGHAIHAMGLDADFDRRLRECYDRAIADGRWKDSYAATNRHEYWAEAVQSWFDTNREYDHDHNHVNTRAELKDYDPAVAALCEEVFGDGEWRYSKPARRAGSRHLDGFALAERDRFAWPEDLDRWWKEQPEARRAAEFKKRRRMRF
jgi:hypothetical protein